MSACDRVHHVVVGDEGVDAEAAEDEEIHAEHDGERGEYALAPGGVEHEAQREHRQHQRHIQQEKVLPVEHTVAVDDPRKYKPRHKSGEELTLQSVPQAAEIQHAHDQHRGDKQIQPFLDIRGKIEIELPHQEKQEQQRDRKAESRAAQNGRSFLFHSRFPPVCINSRCR